MANKSKWAKVCGHNSGESCYNCANRVCIVDKKSDIIVTCNLKYGERTIEFDRRIHPVPFCGAYMSSTKE